ncbi:MAG: RIP metalloprotease RseP [Tissierellia bacterium]|nr:RIP metalloprotease RseP [Tissierellia bacterium]
MTIIYSLLMLLFVILIHEFGHFIVAKLVGVGVVEFSIGMGPELYTTTKNNTLYSLRLLPAGGYVILEGDDEDSIEEVEDENGKTKIIFHDSDSPTAFRNVSIPRRIFVMVAGALMNLFFALVFFTVVASRIGVPSTTIGGFVEGLPAMNSGLKEGDKIIKVDDKTINTWGEISSALSVSLDKANIIVIRGDEILTIEVPIEIEDGRKMVGIMPLYVKDTLSGSLDKGIATMKLYSTMIFDFLGTAINGKASINDLSGPVGVVKEIGKAAKSGIDDLLFFMAYINLNLGIFNLLPVPALDGSKILFLLIEAIRGKAISRKVESAIIGVGVFLLLMLMLLVTYKDILSVFKG